MPRLTAFRSVTLIRRDCWLRTVGSAAGVMAWVCLLLIHSVPTFAQSTDSSGNGPTLLVGTGHTGGITDLALSPSGRYLVSSAEDGTVRVWHRDTGVEVRRFWSAIGVPDAVHPFGDRITAFSIQSSGLGRVDSTLAQGWDVRTGEEVFSSGRIFGFVPSPTGGSFAMSGRGGFLVFATADDTTYQVRVSPALGNFSLTAVSPGGAHVVTGHALSGEVRLWTVRTQQSFPLMLPGATVSAHGAVFSPDGTRLYTWGSNGVAHVWDVATGEPVGTRRVPGIEHAWEFNVLPLADGRIAYVVNGTGVTVLRGDRVQHRLGPHLDATAGSSYAQVTALVAPPDGSVLYTGDSGGQISAWPIPDAAQSVDLTRAPAGDSSLAFPRARRTAWDGERLYLSDAPTSTFSFAEGSARVWVLDPVADTSTVQGPYRGPSVGTTAFAAGGGHAFTRTEDGTMWLWPLRDGAGPDSVGTDESASLSLAFNGVAMSADGRLLLTGDTRGFFSGDTDPGIDALWSVETGTRRLRLQPSASDRPGLLQAAAFSPDGRFVATVHDEDGLRLWSTGDGGLLRRFDGGGSLLSIAFGPDGRRLATGGADGVVRLWSVSSSTPEIAWLGHDGPVHTVAFAPGGQFVASGGEDGTIRIWDRASGLERHTLAAFSWGGVGRVGYTANGHYLMAAGRQIPAIQVWDTRAHTLARTLTYGSTSDFSNMVGASRKYTASVPERRFPEAAFRAPFGALRDGRAVTADASLTGWTWRTHQGRRLVTPWDLDVWSVAMGGGEEPTTLLGLDEGRLLRLSSETGLPIDTTHLAEDGPVDHLVAVAADTTGQVIAAADGTVYHWSAPSGTSRTIYESDDDVYALALSPDGRTALVGDAASHEVVVLALPAGTVTARLPLEFSVVSPPTPDEAASIAVSPDGAYLAVAHTSGVVSLWHLPDRRRIRSWDTHRSGLRMTRHFSKGATATHLRRSAVGFTPDGRLLVGDVQGRLTLHDRTGQPLRRYPPLNGRVLAVDELEQSGRLVVQALTSVGSHYTFALEDGTRLAVRHQFPDGRWVVADDAGRFDTGDLLTTSGAYWRLPDAPLDPLPMEALLRAFYEPDLLRRHLNGEVMPAPPSPSRLRSVLPHVKIAALRPDSDSTFAVTVRVRGTTDSSAAATEAQDLRLLRNGQLVRWHDGPLWAAGDSMATIRFAGVPLPSDTDSLTVHAYAFNPDGVKSPTAHRLMGVPGPVPPRPTTAYVVSLGVNTFADPTWNLSFAAADAQAFQSVLPAHLRDRYNRVVAVPLIAAPGAPGLATKAALQAVLARLAGTATDADRALLARLPDGPALRRATPDDALLITVSTHGFTDSTGTFYLLPSDVAPDSRGQLTPALLRSAVSSADLRAWLRGVDAGAFVMVVDACHSEASVQTAGFKPGPFGSRGLGQLAYSKGMQVIAASQSDDVALELGPLQHGLLTYALVREGLGTGRAWAVPDEPLPAAEWLAWGARRVPTLQQDVEQGTVVWNGRGVKPTGADPERAQQPVVFDFARSRAVVLSPPTSP